MSRMRRRARGQDGSGGQGDQPDNHGADDPSATRLEGLAGGTADIGSPAGTRREPPNGGGVAPDGTRRESPAGGGAFPEGARREGTEGPAYAGRPLPPDLAELFEIIDEIASGGESVVLLVHRRDASGGSRSALKLYHPGFAPDQNALDLIRALPREHVVPILDYGFSGGQFWEEQEYVESGSLADLLVREGPALGTDRVVEIVQELSSALSAVHPVFHRDVKPTNVLVRSFAPLDLVLGDFGLARTSDHTHIVSSVAGSLTYYSPEALSGGASAARDWWAAGMIFAEAAIGHHPFRDPVLGWPSEPEMRIALTTRPVPLDGLDDERLRLLCRGLLVRDPRRRWGAGEVEAWLRGESPPLPDDIDVAAEPVQRPVQPLVFAEQRCATPEALAPVLAENWNEALRVLSQAASQAPEYVRLHTWLDEHGHEAALRVLDQGGQDGSFARRLFRFVRALDPTLPPTYRGNVIDRTGLVALGRLAASGSDVGQSVIADVFQLGIVGEVAREEGHADLIGVDERWHEELGLIPGLQDEMQELSVGEQVAGLSDEGTINIVRAAVLTALLDDSARVELMTVVGDVDQPALRGESGNGVREAFLQIRGDGRSPMRLIAALRVIEPARERYEQAEAQRRAREAEEADRLRAAEEAVHLARRRSRNRRDAAIIVLTVGALASTWPVCLLGSILARTGPLRDTGYVLLDGLGNKPQMLGVALYLTGAIPILLAGAILLCLRLRFHEHRLSLVVLVSLGVAAGVIAFVLPQQRDNAWAAVVSHASTAQSRGPCALSESVAYRLTTGVRQPVLVGPAPRCQTVARLSRRRGHAVWMRWVTAANVTRIHAYQEEALVVGGALGGNLVVVGLGPRTGAELWRRSCKAPGDGANAIAFYDSPATKKAAARRFIRLRCEGRTLLRVWPANGVRIK